METSKRVRPFLATMLVASAVLVVGSPSAGAADPAGIISNSTVSMGVNQEGNLVYDNVGITYDATGVDGIAPGCWCEGWGAGDAVSGTYGSANADSGIDFVEVEDYTRTGDSAVSKVLIPDATDPVLRVTHDYHPSATQYLYEVAVTIENTSDAVVDPRYRRAMDWDIAPTTFDEMVTIQGSETSENVLFASDDGFADTNPFAGESSIDFIGDAIDNGPDDHGALFDFGFDPIGPGESVTFIIYYGVAPSEVTAQAALAVVDAELYSFGQPGPTEEFPDAPTSGKPNTFIFAFKGVGGSVAFDPLVLTPESATNTIGSNHTVTAELTFAGVPVADQEITFEVTSGPHAGVTGTATTAADGTAEFSYTGSATGVDTIVASTVLDTVSLTSQPVTATWTDPAPTTAAPPTTTSPDPSAPPPAPVVEATPTYTG